MILEVILKNIGPFKNKSQFNMVPTSYSGKSANIATDGNGTPMLRVSVIYGANSAGKTNFILTLYRLREELRFSSNAWAPSHSLSELYNPFLLDESTAAQPSEITVKFSVGECVFSYHINFNATEYLLEELFRYDEESPILIMSRSGQNTSKHDVAYFDNSIPESVRFSQVNRSQLALGLFMPFDDNILSTAARYLSVMQIANGYNERMREILWKDVRAWINADRKAHGQAVKNLLNALNIDVNAFSFPQKDDAPFDKIVFKHKSYAEGQSTGKTVELPITKESQGTKWLLLIGAKVIESLTYGYPLFVDELDACYHVQATKFLISLYQNEEINKKNAQLIMTTHNVYLMDERTMRLDQIWLVEKDDKGIADMYSLSEFDDLDENVPLSDWYLANRFGGTPRIGSANTIFAQ